MSLKKFIESVCVQTAVYWEYTGPDGEGGFEYAAAVEIACRWDEEVQVITDNAGKEVVSDAQLLLTGDVVEQSRIKLATLDDLPANPDPLEEDKVYEIKAVGRNPEYGSTTFDIFQAFLSSGGR